MDTHGDACMLDGVRHPDNVSTADHDPNRATSASSAQTQPSRCCAQRYIVTVEISVPQSHLEWDSWGRPAYFRHTLRAGNTSAKK
jgi:hypothetical protein